MRVVSQKTIIPSPVSIPRAADATLSSGTPLVQAVNNLVQKRDQGDSLSHHGHKASSSPWPTSRSLWDKSGKDVVDIFQVIRE